jgi:hypothetical protein
MLQVDSDRMFGLTANSVKVKRIAIRDYRYSAAGAVSFRVVFFGVLSTAARTGLTMLLFRLGRRRPKVPRWILPRRER